jgi:hypothetical protein
MRLILVFFLFSFEFAAAQTRTIHVVVALCDNVNQGIVPVPKSLGNGQDAKNNLYWGAGFGVKTFFKNSKEWTLVKNNRQPKRAYFRTYFIQAQNLQYVFACRCI